jgi:hypothetical protein
MRPKVSEAFAHDEELLHMTARSFVVLAAMEILGIESQDEIVEDKEKLEKTLDDLTSFFWIAPSVSSITRTADHRVDGWKDDYGCHCNVVDGKLTFT